MKERGEIKDEAVQGNSKLVCVQGFSRVLANFSPVKADGGRAVSWIDSDERTALERGC